MNDRSGKSLGKIIVRLSPYFNKNLIRHVVLFSGGIILFVIGVVVYGIILNIREVPLKEALKKKGISELAVVNRHTYSLNLYDDTILVKSYKANFGRNVNTPKTRAGDLSTPVGKYRICKIDTVYKYYMFFKINYPNLNDAGEALRKGWISQTEYDTIMAEQNRKACPIAYTKLGGNIGIHGIGDLDGIFRYLPFVYNWTDGSIAVSNEDMDELYTVIKKGTQVVIR